MSCGYSSRSPKNIEVPIQPTWLELEEPFPQEAMCWYQKKGEKRCWADQIMSIETGFRCTWQRWGRMSGDVGRETEREGLCQVRMLSQYFVADVGEEPCFIFFNYLNQGF